MMDQTTGGDPAGAGVARVEAFSPAEIKRAIYLPHLAIEYILGKRDRLSLSVRERGRLGLMVMLLFVAGLAFSVPYSLLEPVSGSFKPYKLMYIFLLFTGSLLICLPSLHIFNKYVGLDQDPGQSLAMALVISTVAAMVSFGFFPIVWFIHFTSGATPSAADTIKILSNCLLTAAFFMGVLHMGRCFLWSRQLPKLKTANLLVMAFWVCLLTYITYRMGIHLGILCSDASWR